MFLSFNYLLSEKSKRWASTTILGQSSLSSWLVSLVGYGICSMIGELSPLGEIVNLSFKLIVFFGDVCNYVELWCCWFGAKA
jgi:hypothetical protein